MSIVPIVTARILIRPSSRGALKLFAKQEAILDFNMRPIRVDTQLFPITQKIFPAGYSKK